MCAVLAWCSNHMFPDVPTKVVCLPKQAEYAQGQVFAAALEQYTDCRTQTSSLCQEVRTYLYDGLPCVGCAVSAETAAQSEGTCVTAKTHQDCLAISEPLYPPPAGATAAPAPAPVRPSQTVSASPLCPASRVLCCAVPAGVEHTRQAAALHAPHACAPGGLAAGGGMLLPSLLRTGTLCAASQPRVPLSPLRKPGRVCMHCMRCVA